MTLLLFSSCNQRGKAVSSDTASVDSLLCPKYATGYTVKDSAGVRLVDVSNDYHFALVTSDDVTVPSAAWVSVPPTTRLPSLATIKPLFCWTFIVTSPVVRSTIM